VVDPIQTDRLVLRPLSLADVDDLVALDGDSVVMRYINGGRPTPHADIVSIVRRTRGHRWTAVERATNQFIGWFALRPSVPSARDRELGYRLRRDAWGQGFATEGSLAMIDVAFEHLGAERVWAQTMTVNTRSRHVMERCGLRYVRTVHLDWPEPIEGTHVGDVEYEIDRAEWDAFRHPPGAGPP
jgi:RimJ/RimL family protein N-acetyltransferase